MCNGNEQIRARAETSDIKLEISRVAPLEAARCSLVTQFVGLWPHQINIISLIIAIIIVISEPGSKGAAVAALRASE